MTLDVTVVIPTIPGRAEAELLQAVYSVEQQIEKPKDTIIVQDTEGVGPGFMRNFGVNRATTEWIAFLDDDDEFLPHHLATLVHTANIYCADVVWPWFRVQGGTDPFPKNRGKQWDVGHPHIFPITTLVRRSWFQEVGGFDDGHMLDPNDPESGRIVNGEDWRLWLRLSEAGARFRHVDEVTWLWNHHGKNTSGRPDKAKEMYG